MAAQSRNVTDESSAELESDTLPTPPTPEQAERVRVRTLQQAVRLLAAKPRSEQELRDRLAEKEWATPEAIEAAMARLREHDYVNDAQFAQSFASSRLRQKPMGRGLLVRDLVQKKLSDEDVQTAADKAFEELPESEILSTALDRYIAQRGLPTESKEVNRLLNYFMRRGFKYGDIRPLLAAKRVALSEEAENDLLE